MATVLNILDGVSVQYDSKTMTSEMTASMLSKDGDGVIYPDNVFVKYAPIAKFPTGVGRFCETAVKIAIVGAGASGIACAMELMKLDPDSSNSMDITMYECDSEHFLCGRMRNQALGPDGPRFVTTKAGRVMSVMTADTTTGESEVVYEIGAMRIPATAALTWFYTSMFKPGKRLKLFPNPNVVATQFVINEYPVLFKGVDWNNSAMARLVKDFVDKLTSRMFGCNHKLINSLFSIGDMTPEMTKGLLIGGNPSYESKLRLRTNWTIFSKTYDHMSLRNALVITIEDLLPILSDPLPGEIGDFQNFSVLSALTLYAGDVDNVRHDNKLQYYLRIIAGFGFGTGGFGPLFDMSFVDFMRLYLWGYSHEYLLPYDENVKLLEQMYNHTLNLLAVRSRRTLNVVTKKVLGVKVTAGLRSNGSSGNTYEIVLKDDAVGSDVDCGFDYVILAVPPVIAGPIISDLLQTINGEDSRFYYRLLMNSIDQLQMISSSKTFGKVSVRDMNAVPQFENESIRAVLSSDELGSSYFLNNNTVDDNLAFLASYTWDHDSLKQQYQNESYPKSYHTDNMTWIDRFGARRWLAEIVSIMSDKYNYNWTATSGAGGFKLDKPSQNFYSNICARSYKAAVLEGVDVFVAGDSFSHRGGWLEGAFISAVNAVSGLIAASTRNNRGGEAPFDPTENLNEPAKNLFMDFMVM